MASAIHAEVFIVGDGSTTVFNVDFSKDPVVFYSATASGREVSSAFDPSKSTIAWISSLNTSANVSGASITSKSVIQFTFSPAPSNNSVSQIDFTVNFS